jgi:Flp pilus assembly protein TadD
VRRAWLCLALLLPLSGCATLFGPKRSETFEARKRLTRELVARQDWSAAFFYASQLHQEAPADAEVLVLRGIVYRERGLPTEAEADLKDALEKDDRLPEAHAALGIMYDMSNRGEEAEPHHRKAVALAAENPTYLNNLGFSLFLRHKPREAVEAYQRAVRLSPTMGRIRTNLGFAYAALGDWPRASREFEMGAGPAEAKNNLGFAYEQRGDLTNAYSLYLQALRLDPACGHARANLVYVAQKLGKEIPGDLPQAPGEPRSRDR